MDTEHKINYKLLSEAISYYESLGYKYIEVPWIVSKEASRTLCRRKPLHSVHIDAEDYTYHRGDLVGSAEQSFVDLWYRKMLPIGKYVALTPCFRKEEKYDNFHKENFMKVEMFNSILDKSDMLESLIMLKHAKAFFNSVVVNDITFDETMNEVELNTGTIVEMDLEYNNIELGSYGVRQVEINNKNLKYAYGTGLAEPRFSTVMKDFL